MQLEKSGSFSTEASQISSSLLFPCQRVSDLKLRTPGEAQLLLLSHILQTFSNSELHLQYPLAADVIHGVQAVGPSSKWGFAGRGGSGEDSVRWLRGRAPTHRGISMMSVLFLLFCSEDGGRRLPGSASSSPFYLHL